MIDSQDDDMLAQRLRIMRIIHLAMTQGIILSGVVLVFMARGQEGPRPGRTPITSVIAAAFFVLNAGLALVLPSLLTRRMVREVAAGTWTWPSNRNEHRADHEGKEAIMPARQHGVSKGPLGGERRGASAKKATPLGTDLAITVPTAQGTLLSLTYWDVWFALVAAKDYGSELSGVIDCLKANKAVLLGRDSSERKRSHLRDLQGRLAANGLTVDDVVAAVSELARAELRRARKRVLEPTEREREWSEPMRNPPRKRLYAQALRGAWPRFPVSPESYADEIRSKFKKTGFYGENASFEVAHKLNRFVEGANKLMAKKRAAEAQALLRAWLTVVIELIEMADDSYGCIGDSFHEGFGAYLKISLAQTGIDDAVFFADLLSLLIWEDYGLTRRQSEGYLSGLAAEQADWCIAYLRQ